LVHAGAGGVGLMAVQFAKALGCIVIATASPEKLKVCKEFGADYTVNYNEKDWIDQIKKITKGKGCDVIYDPVGLIEQSLKIVAWNGRILVVGFAAGKIEKIAMNKLLLKQCTVQGVYWGGTTVKDPKLVPVIWAGILKWIEEGKLRAPVFEKVYQGIESIPEALRALGNRETWGKVVIKIAGASKL
jgi:NADPH2:quinone reductase